VAAGKKLAVERGAWLCFEDEAGHTLRPPKARTWAPRGKTPVIPVAGKGSGRISVAGLFCVHPDINSQERTHLLYRIKIHRKRKGERNSFAETDYAALLDAAHQHLKAPIVVIWDNLNTHISAAMRQLIAARDWLHVIQLPAYAPDLNPTESVWSPRQNQPGQPRRHQRRPPRRDRPQPTQTHPVPTRTPQRIPRPNRPHTETRTTLMLTIQSL
jgi:hypothetical protein